MDGLGIKNVKAAFQRLAIPISKKQIRLLIKRLDHDRDGLLTYTEVCDIFMPKAKLIKKTFINRNDGST